MSFTESAQDMRDEIVQLRHSLHTTPEIGLHLPRTQEKVLAALDGLPLEIKTGTALSSMTAVLRGGRPGPAVLLRGDMDALPVTEKNDLPYVSRLAGQMHACGHDLHTAMLVGAARLLSARRDELTGDVVFMFQPGEEGHDGAKHMIAEGVLDAAGSRPVAAYGMHVVSSMLPLGLFASRPGPILAAADMFSVTIRGRGGHGSTPHRSLDPIQAGCEMVTALQTMVTRTFDVFDPVVVTVGSFHGGTADNIIPDDARFDATVRTFSKENRTLVKRRLVEVVENIAAAHGMKAEVSFGMGYPVTVNDESEADFLGRTADELFGPGRYFVSPQPVMGSEDFSHVLDAVPGAFVFLGACPPGRDPATAPYNHAPEAVFDDSVLPDGAALYAALAHQRLARG
ncbi:amidohydrolase [Nonomuraea sp. KC401]|uniref:M20 metallopeptidase family protein n=1 Tax=unclassified Nonomuraea TaxID=2593643 RepID=UPI0010FD514C|nr:MULTISPECIES: M20 family metallopeptidase [unclassified Nonomuraea]NBE98274.1 amidohydrolase [Nonomuraea sp. K271]TLF61607.1 amidohydrolase [Nonomuraea sp. KC401]